MMDWGSGDALKGMEETQYWLEPLADANIIGGEKL